jgi:hypothetical protein
MKMSNKGKVIILILLVLIMWVVVPAIFIERQSKTDTNIGQTIVIKQDTLMVLGWNTRTDNYILDDGREVNEEIIRLFKIETNAE